MQELLVSHKRKRFQMRKETKERKNNQLSCRQRERKVRGMALFLHGYLQPAGPACCVWWARVQGKQQEGKDCQQPDGLIPSLKSSRLFKDHQELRRGLAKAGGI